MAWPKPAHLPAKDAQRLLTALPWVVTALAVVLIAYRIAVFSGVLPVESSAVTAAPTDAGPMHAGPAVQAQDLSALAGMHLFGRPAVANRSAVPVSAPDTQLNLTLHGVLVDPDPAGRGAIIGKAGGQQQFFRVGDSVFGSAKLAEVRADRVILSRNGRYETLRFPNVPNLLQPGDPGVPPASTAPTAAVASTTASDVHLQRFRSMAASHPQQLNQYLSLIPVRTTQGFKGFRVLPGKDTALYRQLGLSPVDVLVSVNGRKLTAGMKSGQVLQQLLKSQRPSVQVIRSGAPLELVLHLQ